MSLEVAGLGKLPFHAIGANQLWANLAVLAVNLVSWMVLAVLPAGHVAGVRDVKRWRYRLFSIAGKLTSSARRKRLLIPESAPESQLFTTLLEGAARLRNRWHHGHPTA